MPRARQEMLQRLAVAARSLGQAGDVRIAALAGELRRSVAAAAAEWVRISVTAKQWQDVPEAPAEEWASGPLAVARVLAAIEHARRCNAHDRVFANARLGTAADGATVHRLLGIPGLCDPLLLRGYRIELHTTAHPGTSQTHSPNGTALVLGAGNITATPILDTLDQVLLHRRATVLKLHPVHACLQGAFERALAPLIENDWLRIVAGPPELGATLAHEPSFRAVHLTGSDRTWRTLRADPLLADKTLTAEVGCATPALIVPGVYRAAELQQVARHLAAYCATNGGATCVAPRIVITALDWPQRDDFLRHLGDELAQRPPRRPFLHGVREQFEQATGRSSPAELAPTLLHGGDPARDAAQCDHECFAPVLREITLPAPDTQTFLRDSVAFVRQHCFGALSAYVFAAPRVLATARTAIDHAIADLPHGTVAINCWTGLGYGLGTTPWGVPDTADDDHGRGWVRDISDLGRVRRVVVEAPLRPRPLPPWLPQHRRSAATLRAFTRHTLLPSLPRLLTTAMQGMASP